MSKRKLREQRPKAWLGAAIGVAGSLLGSILGDDSDPGLDFQKEQFAYQKEQNRIAAANRQVAADAQAANSIIQKRNMAEDKDYITKYRLGGRVKAKNGWDYLGMGLQGLGTIINAIPSSTPQPTIQDTGNASLGINSNTIGGLGGNLNQIQNTLNSFNGLGNSMGKLFSLQGKPVMKNGGKIKAKFGLSDIGNIAATVLPQLAPINNLLNPNSTTTNNFGGGVGMFGALNQGLNLYNTIKSFNTGGTTKGKPIEAEGKEKIISPNIPVAEKGGNIVPFGITSTGDVVSQINGNSHANGGVDMTLIPGSRVLSARSLNGFNPSRAVDEGMDPNTAFALQEMIKQGDKKYNRKLRCGGRIKADWGYNSKGELQWYDEGTDINSYKPAYWTMSTSTTDGTKYLDPFGNSILNDDGTFKPGYSLSSINNAANGQQFIHYNGQPALLQQEGLEPKPFSLRMNDSNLDEVVVQAPKKQTTEPKRETATEVEPARESSNALPNWDNYIQPKSRGGVFGKWNGNDWTTFGLGVGSSILGAYLDYRSRKKSLSQLQSAYKNARDEVQAVNTIAPRVVYDASARWGAAKTSLDQQLAEQVQAIRNNSASSSIANQRIQELYQKYANEVNKTITEDTKERRAIINDASKTQAQLDMEAAQLNSQERMAANDLRARYDLQFLASKANDPGFQWSPMFQGIANAWFTANDAANARYNTNQKNILSLASMKPWDLSRAIRLGYNVPRNTYRNYLTGLDNEGRSYFWR